MKDKRFELIRLYKSCGLYVAACYNRLGGYYKDIRFDGYSKKEVIYKLRNEWGVICPKGSY